MIIFMKQSDNEKFSREIRETTEPVAETEAEAEKRQWKAGGRPLEEMIIFMKQIDKEKFGRESRETTEAVAEKRQRKAGSKSLEEMIIFMKQIDKEKSVENLEGLQRQWQRQRSPDKP